MLLCKCLPDLKPAMKARQKLTSLLPVCPSCSNMLTISTLKHHELAPSDQAHAGKNRFECRTCPYQMILDRRYYERKNMETKAADDVLGGADSWKNVDKTEGGSSRLTIGLALLFGWNADRLCSEMSARRLRVPHGVLPTGADSQCRRAHDELLQVRRVRYGVA